MLLHGFLLAIAVASSPAGETAANTCPVTAPALRNPLGGSPVNHGDTSRLATSVWSPVVFRPGGPGCVGPRGALLMKWGWWRGVKGQIAVTGRSLDGRPGTVRVVYPPYGDIGFQASALVFPGPGCWEVTGRVADAAVTFVVLVEKVGEGPSSKCGDLFPQAALAQLTTGK